MSTSLPPCSEDLLSRDHTVLMAQDVANAHVPTMSGLTNARSGEGDAWGQPCDPTNM